MTHGAFTEPSLIDHVGKGREGKGREVGHPSIVSTGSETKRCNRCQQDLAHSAFYRMAAAKDGLQSCCIECRRAYNRDNAAQIQARHNEYLVRTGRKSQHRMRQRRGLSWGDIPSLGYLRRYGITPAQYELMLLTQAGRCGICFGEQDGKRLAIDHDHETGDVRGLLCSRCNLALGIMLDDPQRLRAAAAYLEDRNAWMAADAAAIGGGC